MNPFVSLTIPPLLSLFYFVTHTKRLEFLIFLMADGGWRMADGGWRMTDGGWRMADGSLYV